MLYLLGMIGPKGEKRPGDVIANAVHAARIATGEIEEEYVDQDKRAAGQKGAAARAENLSPEKRQEIAQKAAAARWSGDDKRDTVEEPTPDTRHPTPDTRHPTPDTRHNQSGRPPGVGRGGR